MCTVYIYLHITINSFIITLSMANKTSTLIKKNLPLCEINHEYPVFRRVSPPRHLCANVSIVKQSIPISIVNLSQQTLIDTKEKNSKDSKEQTEIIDLTQKTQENKLYQKRRRNRVEHQDN